MPAALGDGWRGADTYGNDLDYEGGKYSRGATHGQTANQILLGGGLPSPVPVRSGGRSGGRDVGFERRVSSPEDDYDGSTGTGPIPPTPDSRRAKLGPVRSIAREDLGRGRLGCPTLVSDVAGRPARRHATFTCSAPTNSPSTAKNYRAVRAVKTAI